MEQTQEQPEIPEDAKTLLLEARKKYSMCTCGKSKKLPFCDETHKKINENEKSDYASLKILPREKVTVKVWSKNWKKESD